MDDDKIIFIHIYLHAGPVLTIWASTKRKGPILFRTIIKNVFDCFNNYPETSKT